MIFHAPICIIVDDTIHHIFIAEDSDSRLTHLLSSFHVSYGYSKRLKSVHVNKQNKHVLMQKISRELRFIKALL